MNRKYACVAILLVLSVFASRADVLVEDTFDYKVGDLDGAEGGVGWNGPWGIAMTSTIVEGGDIRGG